MLASLATLGNIFTLETEIYSSITSHETRELAKELTFLIHDKFAMQLRYKFARKLTISDHMPAVEWPIKVRHSITHDLK